MSRTPLVITVIIIILLVALVLGVSVTKSLTSESTPLVMTLVTTITTTLASVVALHKTDQVHSQASENQQQIRSLHSSVENGMRGAAVDAARHVADPLDDPQHVERLKTVIAESVADPLDNEQHVERLKSLIAEVVKTANVQQTAGEKPTRKRKTKDT